MQGRFLLFFQLIIIAAFYSCRSSRPIASSSPSSSANRTASEYINMYKDLAMSEMKRTGVPASITLAQGMIESDYGRSRLALEANNHFGIKCHNDWTGPSIRHHDDKRNECFRKYRRPEESFYDHSDFLKSGSRYSSLFDLDPGDYKGWARGLKKAGYATNPDYANMLIRTIEENNLYSFDSRSGSPDRPVRIIVTPEEGSNVQNPDTNRKPVAVFNEKSTVPEHVSRIMENNRIEYIIVKDGDTRETIEKEMQLLRWELPRYNELENDFSPVPGQMLYLQPKRDKAAPGKEYYVTVKGDTMYLISQRFGIKLKSLYEMNRMTEGDEPVIGAKLFLRGMSPVR